MFNEKQLDRMLQQARAEAEQLGVAVNIAIVDAGAHLSAFYRMQGALLGSVDIAQRKAKTAVLFPLPTEALGELVRQEQLQTLELSNSGLILFAGGEPIRLQGQLMGGVGVSGASAEQDKQIARAAIAALSGQD